MKITRKEVSEMKVALDRAIGYVAEIMENYVDCDAEINSRWDDNIKPLEEMSERLTAILNKEETADDDNRYVVLLEWAANDDYGVNVIAVADSADEAEAIFAKEVETEKTIADQNGWEVYSDTESEFDAGCPGFYNENHTCLRIVQKGGAANE